MPAPLPFAFEAHIERFDYGRYAHACIYLPGDVIAAARAAGAARPRFEGEIAGRSWEGAAQPAGAGRAFLILSADFLRGAGCAVGDRVAVALRSIDRDHVRMPEALAEALEAAPDLRMVWDGLSPGTRRGFVHRIESARRPDTRARRVDETLAALESDTPSPYRRGPAGPGRSPGRGATGGPGA